MRWLFVLVVSAIHVPQVIAEGSCNSVSSADLRRAVTKTPRPEYRGQGDAISMSKTLNRHLASTRGLSSRSCDTFNAAQLQDLMRRLAPFAEPQLLAIYSAVGDRRQSKHQTLDDRDASYASLSGHIQASTDLHDVLRDGHCHEAVMMYVHHLTSKQRHAIASDPSFVLPLLPERFHQRRQGLQQISPAANAIHDAYEAAVSCIVCHQSSQPLPPRSDPDAPTWPLQIAPVMPYQFEADVVGWTKDSRNPQGTNVTGTWHYDYLNNRMAQYFMGQKSNMRWWPLKTNVTLVWLASPGPVGEGPAEEVYGKGAARGTFYAFVKPQPFLPWTCEKIPYPSFGIPRPDAFSSSAISANSTFVGREKVDGKWSDHYNYEFLPGGSCNGPFNLWKDIYDHVPVKDFGKNDCKGGNASTHWKVVYKREPPIWRWQNLDYASCNESLSLDVLEQRLVLSAVQAASTLGHDVPFEHLAADVSAALAVSTRQHPAVARLGTVTAASFTV